LKNQANKGRKGKRVEKKQESEKKFLFVAVCFTRVDEHVSNVYTVAVRETLQSVPTRNG